MGANGSIVTVVLNLASTALLVRHLSKMWQEKIHHILRWILDNVEDIFHEDRDVIETALQYTEYIP